MENNGKTLIILLVAALLVAVGVYLLYDYNREDILVVPDSFSNGVSNSEDITPEDEVDWVFSTTTEYTFQYPEDLNLEYVELTDWPPLVQLSTDVFACEEAGEETARAGRTESIMVSGREYCRTTITEGAAGSIYTQYAYAFPFDEGTAIMTFSTRTPQCENYNEAEMAACENEVENLDVDEWADRMARTLVLT